LPLAAMVMPEFDILGLHPVTPVLLAGYLFGYRAVRDAQVRPMWRPRLTAEAVADAPNEAQMRQGPGLAQAWMGFAALAAAMAAAGRMPAEAAPAIAG